MLMNTLEKEHFLRIFQCEELKLMELNCAYRAQMYTEYETIGYMTVMGIQVLIKTMFEKFWKNVIWISILRIIKHYFQFLKWYLFSENKHQFKFFISFSFHSLVLCNLADTLNRICGRDQNGVSWEIHYKTRIFFKLVTMTQK